MTSRNATMSRWHWRHWPVLIKLVAAALVPTLVALLVGMFRIIDQTGAAPGFVRISQIVEVQQKLSELLDALGRERDLATVFVANGRSGDEVALELQFRTVDSRSAAAQTAAEQVEGLESTGYATVLDQLPALRPVRQDVTNGTGPVEVVMIEYGAAIDPLIALDAALTRQLADVAVADDAAATHALLVVGEQVRRQHAIVLAALIAERIGAAEIGEVQAAATRLATEQGEFERALDPEYRVGYVARALGDAELSRQQLLQQVLDRGQAEDALEVAPADWDERTAAAVEGITGVRNELRQRIDQTAQGLRDDAHASAGWNAAILFLVLALGVLVAVLLARSMLRPLSVLRRAALDVAGQQLPAAMVQVRDGGVPDEQIEPVAISTREEIGQVARAFDEVHRQAVRMAREQAQLRAHVNDIFVNLARRSQGLVERQIQVIDRLEGGELDPQQLENLFQLDHLATRMRRNSDNLLVLAGTDVVKRASRPVRLVDVFRAAMSEVEQYQRLKLQQPPGVVVLGRAAGDLVHLLAELLDNATQFSPPDTQVILHAESLADGSVEIEITDRGVGMTGSELTEANARLATPPVVDASVSRRMGLFVVSRLAIRHGVGVRLRRGDKGTGVVACVTMPPRLVRSTTESSAGTPGVTVVSRESPPAMSVGGHLTNGNGVREAVARASGKTLAQASSAPRPAQQASTPIFDDVASAWFQEHHGIPGEEVAAAARTERTAAAPTGQPVYAAATTNAAAPSAATATAVTAPTRGGAHRADWGSADDGWRAAQALARPEDATVTTEVTVGGLPRRTPLALLVPGAAGEAAPAETKGSPIRSPELIRSRLTSYQQGVREGRHTRRNLAPDANGSVQQQQAQ
ncbi:MAG: nitrate- and nitrite sensing domain-containing protein [Pseudonocardiaceae bacterium]